MYPNLHHFRLNNASLPQIIHPPTALHSLSVITTNTQHIKTSSDTGNIHLEFQVATSVLIITITHTPNSINSVRMNILQLNFEQKLLIGNHCFAYDVLQTTYNFITEGFQIISVLTKT
jgi:hypothetical protein